MDMIMASINTMIVGLIIMHEGVRIMTEVMAFLVMLARPLALIVIVLSLASVLLNAKMRFGNAQLTNVD